VTDAWEPLYSRRNGGIVEIGLIIGRSHRNSRGFLHGGVIAALADNAMGLSYHDTRVKLLGEGKAPKSGLTVTLSIDFLSTARSGAWLQVTPRVLRAGKVTGFVDATITADDEIIARASAIFLSITTSKPRPAVSRSV
jgi:acyl-coenzyme A thioesterase PaaI-like protein